MSQTEDWGDGWNAGRNQGIRYSIATVEAIDDGGDANTRYILASAAAMLRALLEGTDTPPPLPPSVGIPEKKGSLW